jgi:pilus assembly protein Flp/PilA
LFPSGEGTDGGPTDPADSPLAKAVIAKTNPKGDDCMKFDLLNLYTRLQRPIWREEGQDLLEYALVVALIAFAATAGMSSVATDVNALFVQIGTIFTNATS